MFAHEKPLSPNQIRALVILSRHRSRPVTDLRTTEAAINDNTAWSLEERQLAAVRYDHRGGGYTIKILPQAKQLIKLR